MDKVPFNVSLHRAKVNKVVKKFTGKGHKISSLFNKTSKVFPDFATQILAEIYQKPKPWSKYPTFFEGLVSQQSLFDTAPSSEPTSQVAENVWKLKTSAPEPPESASPSFPEPETPIKPLRITGGLNNAAGPLQAAVPANLGVLNHLFDVQEIANAQAYKAFVNEAHCVGGSVGIGGLTAFDGILMTANVTDLRFEPNQRKMIAAHMGQFSTDIMERAYDEIDRNQHEIALVSDLDSNNAMHGILRPVVVDGLNVPRDYGLVHAINRRVYAALNVANGGSRLFVREGAQNYQQLNINNILSLGNWTGVRRYLPFCKSYEGVKAMLREMSTVPMNADQWTVLNDIQGDDFQTQSLKLFLRISARLFRAVCQDDIGLAQQELNESLGLSTPQLPGQLPLMVMRTSNGFELPCWFASIETEIGMTLGNDPPNMPLATLTIAIPEFVKNTAQIMNNGQPAVYRHKPTFQEFIDAVEWLKTQGPVIINNEFSHHPFLVQFV